MAGLTRREFIGRAPAILLVPQLFANAHAPIVLIFVYAPTYERAKRAAEMSAAEVGRAATLLRRDFRFHAVPAAAWSPPYSRATAIIAATTHAIETQDVPVVDIANTLPCAANVLKLTPPLSSAGSPPLRIWHEGLARYGAAQLNDRFNAAGITPDDQAWLGWFAVKLLWEAAVRGRSPRELSYDGHKGMALEFNPAGMLMQPLYIIEGNTVKQEIRPDAAQESAPCVS